MEEVVFNASPRSIVGKQVRALRREGGLPAVIYGRNFEPINVTLNLREATKTLSTVTSSHIVTINVDGKKYNALVRDRQRHPVSGLLLHVDFQRVSMTEKLRTSVVIALEGEAPAVKEFGGVVVTGLESLEVESLPGDLPERIEVDLSNLREVGDAVYVRDIQLPSAVEVLTDPEEMVVLVTAPASEAEMAIEEPEAAEPEVIERGGKEEEEE